MVLVYFLGALITSILLVGLSIFIFLKNYNRQTARFAVIFFLFGIMAMMFIYFGVYNNLPEVETRERIEEGIADLEQLRNKEESKKERIRTEIKQIYNSNEELIAEFSMIQQNGEKLSYAQAVADEKVNSILTFLQHNYANIQGLSELEGQIDRRIKQIELDVLRTKADLVTWESSGGIDGDLGSYMLEEHIFSRIAVYQQKIEKPKTKSKELRPMSEVWEALLKHRL